ncbi:MAG: hypothetical protein JWO67_6396 [Streptosporangiaceae bacterium]|nr:hypothetical protein [Streptosporangiaceae bacterium]
MSVVIWIIVIVAVLAAIGKAVASRGGKAENARIRGYGIVVDGDRVKSGGQVLGPLAGSEAVVTDGTSRHTLTRVVTVAGALTKKTKASMIIAVPGGEIKESKLDGASQIRAAQSWAVRFNAMAREAARPVAPGEALPDVPGL